MKLILKNLNKSFGDFSISNINLEIKKGEYFVILGPSGAGKSLLFDIIAGLKSVDSGKIMLSNNNITNLPVQKRNIGLVFQENTLFPHLNVLNNIRYALNLKKIKKGEQNEMIDKLAGELNIKYLLHRNTSSLSGGEQNRVLLARTLAVNPDILLLDEPLSSLDTRNKVNIKFLLKELNSKGLTILHITHDLDEALFLSNRIAFMDNGRITQYGKPADLLRKPENQFIANFLGINNYFTIKQIKEKEIVLKNNFIVKTQLTDKSLEKLIIPESSIHIDEPGILNYDGLINHAVQYADRLVIYIDAGIKLQCNTSITEENNRFRPGKKISFDIEHSELLCF